MQLPLSTLYFSTFATAFIILILLFKHLYFPANNFTLIVFTVPVELTRSLRIIIAFDIEKLIYWKIKLPD